MKKRLSRIFALIKKAPLLSFLALLGLLLAVIAFGNALRAPELAEETQRTTIKAVDTFIVGDVTFADASGHVEKNDVVTVTAQTSGIVYRVHTLTGAQVPQEKGLV